MFAAGTQGPRFNPLNVYIKVGWHGESVFNPGTVEAEAGGSLRLESQSVYPTDRFREGSHFKRR